MGLKNALISEKMVLPMGLFLNSIAPYDKYKTISRFLEYDMAAKIRFSEYFGFSKSEVDVLYQRYITNTKHPNITRQELTDWYDGYHTASGEHLSNPRSVISTLTNNQLAGYWTGSGIYDSIFYYVRHNLKDVRTDLGLMVAGERIAARIQEYAATSAELNTKVLFYLTITKQNWPPR